MDREQQGLSAAGQWWWSREEAGDGKQNQEEQPVMALPNLSTWKEKGEKGKLYMYDVYTKSKCAMEIIILKCMRLI